MKVLVSLILIVLIWLSSASHLYYLLKKQEYRTLKVIVSMISLAIISGVLMIFGILEPSIASMFNSIHQIVK